jgi:hypothetical protein
MPGVSLSRENRRLDTVIVSVRYRPDDGELTLARAYERRGAVWTDLVLLDRPAVVEHLRAGKRVVAGTLRSLPGDFQVMGTIRLEPSGASGKLVIRARSNGRDDLGLPLF